MSIEKVREWLNKSGFPLEMAAAASFRAAGFEVRQSHTYQDPQMDKGREIDVFAKWPDFLGVVDISFVIECKSSAQPWVVLKSNEASANVGPLHAFAVMSPDAVEGLASRIGRLGALSLFFGKTPNCGYGFRQAFGRDSDPAYVAAVSAFKAAAGVAGGRIADSIPRLAFCFPVIVVDAPLYEVSLASNGELELSEVEFSEFAFSVWIPQLISTVCKVVTKPYLDSFSKEAALLADAIRFEFKSEERKAL